MNNLIKAKILNIAWVGQGDFGDEAMAFALRKYFKGIGIDSITYYQHGRFPNYRTQDDLKISALHEFTTGRWEKFFLDKFYLRNFNAIILGGGSILHSYSSIKWKLDIIKKIKDARKNYTFSACVGVSLGPFKSAADEAMCGSLFNYNDIIILRDNFSYELAKKIGTNKKIHPSLDTTLLLPELCADRIPKNNNKYRKENDLVGAMFIRSRKEDSSIKDEHLKKYLTIINNILERGKRIILFTFYLGVDFYDDELNQLLKNNSQWPDKIEIYAYNGDIFETINKLNQCSYIISMRLHGIVFAYILGIPFLSIAYDLKNQNFCDSIGYPGCMSFNFYALNDIKPVMDSLNILFKENIGLFSNVLPVNNATELVNTNLNLLTQEMNKILS